MFRGMFHNYRGRAKNKVKEILIVVRKSTRSIAKIIKINSVRDFGNNFRMMTIYDLNTVIITN